MTSRTHTHSSDTVFASGAASGRKEAHGGSAAQVRSNADVLWAVHITGSDDLVPVASYLDAIRIANAFNAWWEALNRRTPLSDNDPRMWAGPVEYDGDAGTHAEWMRSPHAAFFDANFPITHDCEAKP